MASITPILGTDSISSSRIVINSNFESIKTELSSISSVLNTQAQTLVLTGAITSTKLSVVSGASDLFLVNSTDIISGLSHTFKQNVVFEGAVIGSFVGTVASPAAILPTNGNWTYETYVLGAGTFTMSSAIDGQQVTLVAADAAGFTLDNSVIAGEAVDVVIAEGKTISLRYLGSFWYVISKN